MKSKMSTSTLWFDNSQQNELLKKLLDFFWNVKLQSEIGSKTNQSEMTFIGKIAKKKIANIFILNDILRKPSILKRNFLKWGSPK